MAFAAEKRRRSAGTRRHSNAGTTRGGDDEADHGPLLRGLKLSGTHRAVASRSRSFVQRRTQGQRRRLLMDGGRPAASGERGECLRGRHHLYAIDVDVAWERAAPKYSLAAGHAELTNVLQVSGNGNIVLAVAQTKIELIEPSLPWRELPDVLPQRLGIPNLLTWQSRLAPQLVGRDTALAELHEWARRR